MRVFIIPSGRKICSSENSASDCPLDAGDHDTEQEITGVAVFVFDAGRLRSAASAGQAPALIRGSSSRRHRAPAAHRDERDVVAKSARVMHEMPERHALRARGEFGQVLHERIVERQLALLLQEQQRKSRELLRNRGEIERRMRVEWLTALDIGQSEGERMRQRAVFGRRRPCSRVRPASRTAEMISAMARSAGVRPQARRGRKRQASRTAVRTRTMTWGMRDPAVRQDSHFDSNC